MKHKIKKFLMPFVLIVLGITSVSFISFFKTKNPEVNNNVYNKKFIKIKIKDKYPFPLLFPKGSSLSDILKKFNVGYKNIYVGKKHIFLNSKIYEDTTFQIKSK